MIFNADFSSHIFITFSLVTPTIYLFRLVLSVILRIQTLGGCSNIYIIIFEELFNTSNFKFSKNSLGLISNIFIFAFLGCLALDTFYITYSNSSNHCVLHNEFFIWSYNDISVPNNTFSNYVRLNPLLGVTYNWLVQRGAVHMNVSTGGYDLLDFHMKLNNTSWYRTNGGLYYTKSYLKTSFTRHINHVTSIPVNPNFNFNLNIPSSYTNHNGVNQKLLDVALTPNSESEVDGLVCTLCAHLFKYDNNYTLNPQSNDSNLINTRSGKIDFKVNHRGNPILIIEDKHGQGDSWLDAVEQAHRYCVNNDVSENIFVLIFRGTYMSAFLHQMDWHTDNKFHLKYPDYQDLLGLEVNNSGVGLIPPVQYIFPSVKDIWFKTSCFW